jgi:hypothetical protein
MRGSMAAGVGVFIAATYAAAMTAGGLMCPPIAISAIIPFWVAASAAQKALD